jgi:WD40 repeat protein
MSLVELDILVGHEDRVWCLSWSPDGKTLASCSGDKNIRLWQKEGKSEQNLPAMQTHVVISYRGFMDL